MTREKSLRTVAAGNGIASDAAFGAVTPPIYLSSTFSFAGYEQSRSHDYSRTANPSRTCWPIRLPNSKAAWALW